MKKRLAIVLGLAVLVEVSILAVVAHYRMPVTTETLALRAKIDAAKEARAEVFAQLERMEQLADFEQASGLANSKPGVGREAVRALVAKGPPILPKMHALIDSSDRPIVRTRAKEVIGKITGNWGSTSDLIWDRSLADAVNKEKPILLLQLFGNLDEEFC